jgi:hypothetical protein
MEEEEEETSNLLNRMTYGGVHVSGQRRLSSYHHHWPRLAAVNQGHYQEYVVEADSQLHTILSCILI